MFLIILTKTSDEKAQDQVQHSLGKLFMLTHPNLIPFLLTEVNGNWVIPLNLNEYIFKAFLMFTYICIYISIVFLHKYGKFIYKYTSVALSPSVLVNSFEVET